MEKVGLNQDQASKAAETAISFVKERLPASFHGELDKLMGSGQSQGTLGNLTRKAGSVFGPE
jgi:hypothetical protein